VGKVAPFRADLRERYLVRRAGGGAFRLSG